MTVNTPPSVNGELDHGAMLDASRRADDAPARLQDVLATRAAEVHPLAAPVPQFATAVAPAAAPGPQYVAVDPRAVEDPGMAARRVVRGPFRVLVGLFLLFAVIVALCAEAAYLWADSKPEVWAARTEIQYVGGAWVETEAEALRSDAVIRPVAEAEGIDTVDFLENLTAGQVPGTEVLAIEFRDEDPNVALRVVTNYSNLYLQRFEVPEVSAIEEAIQARLIPLEARLDDVVTADLAAGVGNDDDQPTDEQIVLRAEANQLRLEIGSLQDQLTVAELDRIEEAENQPVVIEAPFVYDEPVEPQPAKRAVLGGLLGAVIGSLVLFVLVWRVL